MGDQVRAIGLPQESQMIMGIWHEAARTIAGLLIRHADVMSMLLTLPGWIMRDSDSVSKMKQPFRTLI
jgi:hypothetical protein